MAKKDLAKFVPRIYLFGGAGKMSGKRRANPVTQSETGTLAALAHP